MIAGTANKRKHAPIIGYRTMTAAQRYNARMARLWDECRDVKTRFNESSRVDVDTEQREQETQDSYDYRNEQEADRVHPDRLADLEERLSATQATQPPAGGEVVATDAWVIEKDCLGAFTIESPRGVIARSLSYSAANQIVTDHNEHKALKQRITELEAALREMGCTCRTYPHDPAVTGCNVNIARRVLNGVGGK